MKKYTKLYSGGIPVFTEDNIFEIVIPMNGVTDLIDGQKRVTALIATIAGAGYS